MISAIIYFIIFVAVIYFAIVVPYRHVSASRGETAFGDPAPTKTCPYCLSDVPAEASKCKFCTSALDVAVARPRSVTLEIDLSGRVALVTGGSRGLGRADALTLARAGADVAIADIQIESAEGDEADRYGPLAQAARQTGMVYTESTAAEIEGMGRRALALRCDVTDREQVASTVDRVVSELGSVDILVNNAGTLDHVGQLGDQQPELVGARPGRQPDAARSTARRRSGRT